MHEMSSGVEKMPEVTLAFIKGAYFLLAYIMLFLNLFSSIGIGSFLLSIFMYVTSIFFGFCDQMIQRTVTDDRVFACLKKNYYTLLVVVMILFVALMVSLKFSAYSEKVNGIDVIFIKVVLMMVCSYAAFVNLYRHYKVSEEIKTIKEIPREVHVDALRDQQKAMHDERIKREAVFDSLTQRASEKPRKRNKSKRKR